ncbi:phosphatidylglycerol lysyltransferase domain-containing protein [Yoonia sp. R2331]|uniref:phosphatidylglycerol lysyltransferase domain-containing protein n=1 Tax=Yoonia sp. R2331 TaxID=3237238 RepID=UPI0034E4301D
MLLSLIVVALCLPAAWDTLETLDVTQLQRSFAALAPWQWLTAMVVTGVSFAALGRYDAIWHRIMDTSVSEQRARRVGMAAIAVSQSLGLTAVTAGISRWRGLPDLSPFQIAKLSGAVGLSFLTGWAICGGMAAVWLGLIPGAVAFCALVVGCAGAFFCTALWIRLPLRFRTALPALLGWVALDLSCAGVALWLLLPADTDLPLLTVIAAYVLALGAGLLGNSPGGVGPFEVVLLALLPALPAPELLAGLLAFRVVYYLIPFAVGAIYLMRPVRPSTPIPLAGPADWGLARQSGAVERVGKGWGHIVRPLGVPVLLGDPLGSGPQLPLVPIYKASGRSARRARRAGWVVARIADDAQVALHDWSLDGPRKKRLRQALRRAAARGISIEAAKDDLPIRDLRVVAMAWARTHGGELGLTVGRYCPGELAQQRVFLIRHDGEIAGFVTFQVADTDWALDLIRYRAGLPDGAVQSAIVAGLDAAKAAGAMRCGLGAVPAQTGPLARWGVNRTGLRHFKSLFDPIWRPRYFMAPGRIGFVLSAAALFWGIQRPVPRLMNKLHHLVASFGVATVRLTRHTRATSRNREPPCPQVTTR